MPLSLQFSLKIFVGAVVKTRWHHLCFICELNLAKLIIKLQELKTTTDII